MPHTPLRPFLANYRRWSLLLLFPLWLSCTNEAIDPDAPTVVGPVYTSVDQPPMPQGGQAGLNQYLMQNVRYPSDAQKANIQGKVIVSFVVTKTGQIADVQAIQHVGGGCDEEAIRVIREMPDWSPGLLDGQPVNVSTSVPITFTLL